MMYGSKGTMTIIECQGFSSEHPLIYEEGNAQRLEREGVPRFLTTTPLVVSSIWLVVPTALAPPKRFFQPHLHICLVVL